MHELFDMLGIKGPVVAAGLAGGVLRALSRHRYKLREMIASPICGALAAAYLTLPAVAWFRILPARIAALPLTEPSVALYHGSIPPGFELECTPPAARPARPTSQLTWISSCRSC